MNRVVITGIGSISSLGKNTPELFENLKKGKTGISQVKLFDVEGRYETQIAAGVSDDNFINLPLDLRLTRTDKLAFLAAKEALENLDDEYRQECGILSGGTTGAMAENEKYLRDTLSGIEACSDMLKYHPIYTTTEKLSRFYNLHGPRLTLCTACSSSLNSIILASHLIEIGKARLMLAGGADSLCEFTFSGFHCLSAMDKKPCEPFSIDRNGLTLGEAGAFLLLEEYEHALKRGAKIYGEIYGSGITSDAYHITQPHPEGRGAAEAIKLSLKKSRLNPGQIDYINAHGTGTKANDIMEYKAIKQAFENRTEDVFVSSTKGGVGHTLGAAGGLESVISLLALNNQFIPPNINLNPEKKDPQIDLNIVTTFCPVQIKKEIKFVMNNSFGFGGSNSCIIFGKPGEKTGRTYNYSDKKVFLYFNKKDNINEFPNWKEVTRRVDDLSRSALESCANAVQNTKLTFNSDESEKIGVMSSSTWGNLDLSVDFLKRLYQKGVKFVRPVDFPNTVLNAPSGYISILTGAKGINLTFTHIETGPLWALVFGYESILNGDIDKAIVSSFEKDNIIIKELGKCRLPGNCQRISSSDTVILQENSSEQLPLGVIIGWNWGKTKEISLNNCCSGYGYRQSDIKTIITSTDKQYWNESILLHNLLDAPKNEVIALIGSSCGHKNEESDGYLTVLIKIL